MLTLPEDFEPYSPRYVKIEDKIISRLCNQQRFNILSQSAPGGCVSRPPEFRRPVHTREKTRKNWRRRQTSRNKVEKLLNERKSWAIIGPVTMASEPQTAAWENCGRNEPSFWSVTAANWRKWSRRSSFDYRVGFGIGQFLRQFNVGKRRSRIFRRCDTYWRPGFAFY